MLIKRSAPLRYGTRVGRKNPDRIRGAWLKKSTRLRTKGRSYTRTTTKKKQQRATKTTDGGSQSTFNYGRRARPKILRALKSVLGKRYQLYNGQRSITAGVNIQQIDQPLVMFNVLDLKAMQTALDGSDYTQRILFESCTARLHMTNQDNGITKVILYDCIARRDSPGSTYNTPSNTWYQGLVLEGAGNALTVPNSTPFTSALFCRSFKVLKTTHVVMAPGQYHEHRVHFAPNKFIEGSIFGTLNGDTMKGLTCFTMVVVHGTPAGDAGSVNTVIGRTQVDCVWTKEYRYIAIEDNSRKYAFTNSLPALVGSEIVMNAATGASAIDAQAN